jgi:hypothetical protein
MAISCEDVTETLEQQLDEIVGGSNHIDSSWVSH